MRHPQQHALNSTRDHAVGYLPPPSNTPSTRTVPTVAFMSSLARSTAAPPSSYARASHPCTSFNWTYPHCKRAVTILEVGFSSGMHILYKENVPGNHAVTSCFMICPNPECNQHTLEVPLQGTTLQPGQGLVAGEVHKMWRLVPWGASHTFPDYVPKAIRDNYREACSIVELSPKAATALGISMSSIPLFCGAW